MRVPVRLFLIALLTLVLTGCDGLPPYKGRVTSKKYHPASSSVSFKTIISNPEKWTLDVEIEPDYTMQVVVTKEIFDQADVGEYYDDETKLLTQ